MDMPTIISKMAHYSSVGFKQGKWWATFITSYLMDLISMALSKTTSLKGENLWRDSSNMKVNFYIICFMVKANRRQNTTNSKESTIKARESREDLYGIIKILNAFIRDSLIKTTSFMVRVHFIGLRHIDIALRSLQRKF
jgi:hypothetical protein